MAKITQIVLVIIALAIGYESDAPWQSLLYTVGVIAATAATCIVNWLVEKTTLTPQKRRVHCMAFIAMYLVFAVQMAIIYFASRLSPYLGGVALCSAIHIKESLNDKRGDENTEFVLALLSGIAILVVQKNLESRIASLLCLTLPLIYFYFKGKWAYGKRNRERYSGLHAYPILLKLHHLIFVGCKTDIVKIDKLFYKLTESDKSAKVMRRPTKYAEKRDGNGECIEIPAQVVFGTTTYEVTSIDEKAFAEDRLLESIRIPKSVTSIGESAFEGCSHMESINIPGKITSIGEKTFYRCCNITHITIPDGVTDIGTEAFSNCNKLESIAIPESMKSIGEKAFYGCDTIEEVSIPKNVEKIGGEAFADCRKLTRITISEGIDRIWSKAFCLCTGLKEIVIPESATRIEEKAFFYCPRLKSIRIPKGVTKIEAHAFYFCTSLESIRIEKETPPQTDGEAFDMIQDGATLYIPQGAKATYPTEAAPWNEFKIVEMGDTSLNIQQPTI